MLKRLKTRKLLWSFIAVFLILLVITLLLTNFKWPLKYSDKTITKAVDSQSPIVFKSTKLKNQALKKGYIPLLTTSNFSQKDAFYPNTYFKKYQSQKKFLVLGGKGCNSMAQYLSLRESTKSFNGKKAIVVLSPQAFIQQNTLNLNEYYSKATLAEILLKQKKKLSVADKYFYKQLQKDPKVTGVYQRAINDLLTKKKISGFDRTLLTATLNAGENSKYLLSRFNLPQNWSMTQGINQLPASKKATDMTELAKSEGNIYGPKKKYQVKNLNYVTSAEYSNLQLLLNYFNQRHTNVLFIIAPVKGKMNKQQKKNYEEGVSKINYQLSRQGFFNIVDYSSKTKEKYFMESQTDLGWLGWLSADKRIEKFINQPDKKYNYDINPYYLSSKWQLRTKIPASDIANSAKIHQQSIETELARLGFKSNALVLKNGQKWFSSTAINNLDSAYLINSVQKSMTATMVMQLIQDKKLSLNDHISRFFPNIAGGDKVQIKDLLQMTAGLKIKAGTRIGNTYLASDNTNLKTNIAKTEYVPSWKGKWVYSSLDYFYLSEIVAKLTHKSYKQAFTDTYIKPLKLKHTAFIFDSDDQLRKVGFVNGSTLKNGKYLQQDLAKAKIAGRNELGAGSIVMSNGDLTKVIQTMLSGKMLTNKAKKYLFSATSASPYNGGFYNYSNYKAANGAGNGFYTFVRTDPTGQNLFIVQTNQTAKGKFGKAKKRIDYIWKNIINTK